MSEVNPTAEEDVEESEMVPLTSSTTTSLHESLFIGGPRNLPDGYPLWRKQ